MNMSWTVPPTIDGIPTPQSVAGNFDYDNDGNPDNKVLLMRLVVDACEDMKNEVNHRDVNSETVRRELVLEMERRRRLEGIYDEHKELDIQVEKPE